MHKIDEYRIDSAFRPVVSVHQYNPTSGRAVSVKITGWKSELMIGIKGQRRR